MPIFLEKKYENDIYLAVWKIEESLEALQAMLSSEILTDAELASINHPQKKREFLCSRLVIRHLAKKLKVSYEGIKKDEYGKPYLIGTEWKLSLTHTNLFTAVAMHPTQELGIDIEKPSEKMFRIAHKFLSEKEIIKVNNDLNKISIYWSAKEALYKLYGKRKVIFNENLYIFPFHFPTIKTFGQLKINDVNEKYTIYIETLESFFLVVAGNPIKQKIIHQ